MVDKDLEEIRDKVPGLKKGSSQLFRTLRDKGIISYTEYLFLLSVLTSK
jgi:calcium uptake protein 3, mitochondrial